MVAFFSVTAAGVSEVKRMETEAPAGDPLSGHPPCPKVRECPTPPPGWGGFLGVFVRFVSEQQGAAPQNQTPPTMDFLGGRWQGEQKKLDFSS